MDILASDLENTIAVNNLVGNKCCSLKLKELVLPNHPDWIYVSVTCLSCKTVWKIWRNLTEINSTEF